jgi:hypothetical protein
MGESHLAVRPVRWLTLIAMTVLLTTGSAATAAALDGDDVPQLTLEAYPLETTVNTAVSVTVKVSQNHAPVPGLTEELSLVMSPGIRILSGPVDEGDGTYTYTVTSASAGRFTLNAELSGTTPQVPAIVTFTAPLLEDAPAGLRLLLQAVIDLLERLFALFWFAP